MQLRPALITGGVVGLTVLLVNVLLRFIPGVSTRPNLMLALQVGGTVAIASLALGILLR